MEDEGSRLLTITIWVLLVILRSFLGLKNPNASYNLSFLKWSTFFSTNINLNFAAKLNNTLDAL